MTVSTLAVTPQLDVVQRSEQLSSEVLRVVAIPVTMGIPGREI